MGDTSPATAEAAAPPPPQQAQEPPQLSANASASASAQRRRRVLTVGDGNFSFSLAYAKRHADDANAPEMTATSYDSYEELVAKYPESKRICAQLHELDVRLLHRVDATNLRASLLTATVTDPDAAGSSADVAAKFDAVVFNHPHCGEENVRRHQSLLSHFYASALEVLADNGEEDEESGIHLTLAQGQPERWEALARAERAGLKLHWRVEDVDADERFGLRYERKRHQNGKSFHQVTLHGEKTQQASTLFIFRRAEQGAKPEETKKTAIVVETDTGASRKRKAQTQLRLEFACSQCDRSFKSAQGLRTHVHMVHELEAAAPAAVELPCPFCDRSFKQEDARRQHELAKHGKDPVIRPDWFQQQQEPAIAAPTDKAPPTGTSSEQPKPKTCAICKLEFATQGELEAHWEGLQPRAAAKRRCAACGREFDEERALRQHQNFCGQATAS